MQKFICGKLIYGHLITSSCLVRCWLTTEWHLGLASCLLYRNFLFKFRVGRSCDQVLKGSIAWTHSSGDAVWISDCFERISTWSDSFTCPFNSHLTGCAEYKVHSPYIFSLHLPRVPLELARQPGLDVSLWRLSSNNLFHMDVFFVGIFPDFSSNLSPNFPLSDSFSFLFNLLISSDIASLLVKQ